MNIPISKSLISRRFGTFRKAKEAAGLDPEETNRSAPNYTDEQLIENLAQARQEIEGRLSTAKYTGWRREKQRQANQQGTHVDIPCDFTYDQRFGGWLKAVEKVEELPLRQHGGIGPPVYTPDWIAEKLLEAYSEIGDPFYISGYQKWSKAKREQDTEFPPPDRSHRNDPRPGNDKPGRTSSTADRMSSKPSNVAPRKSGSRSPNGNTWNSEGSSASSQLSSGYPTPGSPS